ncbi:MAG: nucleotide-binding protein, partial [Bacteroidia bacterium]|nr:nucleotide-binding protein [Bacteroidia bacterium]
MANIKTKIFVGSSGTNYSVAEKIIEKLELVIDADFIPWKNPRVFEFNKSTLHSLLKGRLLYDFAILVATKDDIVISKGITEASPRDNVIFEFGLYLGSLGENRTIIIHEKGAKMLSDMAGITVPVLELDDNFNTVIEAVAAFINEKKRYNEFHTLPSTTLAVGYFYSFLSNTCASLIETPDKFELDGRKFISSKIKVIIPKE